MYFLAAKFNFSSAKFFFRLQKEFRRADGIGIWLDDPNFGNSDELGHDPDNSDDQNDLDDPNNLVDLGRDNGHDSLQTPFWVSPFWKPLFWKPPNGTLQYGEVLKC